MNRQCRVSVPTGISVVIPVFRSIATLIELHARLTGALSKIAPSHELVFVDDACPGGSGKLVQQLAATDSSVRVIFLNENQGQHRAALLGLSHARGDRIVLMDADLQDPPEAISELIEPLDDGYDAVFARPPVRAESLFREATSRLFKSIVDPLFGIPTGVGMFVAMTGQMRDTLLEYHPRHVYLPGMIGLSGLPHLAIPVPRASRPSGRSAYSAWRRIRFAIAVMRCFAECAVTAHTRAASAHEVHDRRVAKPTRA